MIINMAEMLISAIFMKKSHKYPAHLYLLIGYFAINSSSLVIHESYIYATYELLFLLHLILGSVYAYKTKDTKSLIKQSLIAHLVLFLLYSIALFYHHDLTFNSLQALLVLFPIGHFIISVSLFLPLGLKKKNPSKC